jgi:hypothetical protein
LRDLVPSYRIREVGADGFQVQEGQADFAREEGMIIALTDIILIVTAFVSFLYGTRIAWSCGKNCNSRKTPEERTEKIKAFMPGATLVYFFGFAITANYFFELVLGSKPDELGSMAILLMSLINAFLAANAIAWFAMPKSRSLF